MDFLDKINQLPGDIRDFLFSDQPRHETEKVCFLYGLGENAIGIISDPVAPIFIKEISLGNLPGIISSKLRLPGNIAYGVSYELARRIFLKFPDYLNDAPALVDQWSRMKSNPVISEDEAWKKVLALEPWIMEEEKEKSESVLHPKEEERYKPVSEQLTLIDAMKKYADLGEQQITTDQIIIKHFQEPVRPSLKNWLADYTAHLGYEHHSSIERGNYLFQTENTKNLSYQDRQKLSQALKSFDEKTPLEIDMQTKQIIFQRSLPERKHEPKPIPAPVSMPSSFSTRPIENSQPAYGSVTFEPEPREEMPKTSSDVSVNAVSAPIPNAYQPKTQEPKDDFEKVIQLEEKNDEPFFSNAPRVVNLREPKKEKPVLLTPPVKNLLNIKELIGISQQESKNGLPKPLVTPSQLEKPVAPIKTNLNGFSAKPNSQTEAKSSDASGPRPLSSSNNFIGGTYKPTFFGKPHSNGLRESLDSTEKQLLESNNSFELEKERIKETPNNVIGGVPIKDFTKKAPAPRSSMQPTSAPTIRERVEMPETIKPNYFQKPQEPLVTSFTSPQKLPHEKEQEEIEKKPVVQEKPQNFSAFKSQPYRIHPASFEES
jgi:hypothetical protein